MFFFENNYQMSVVLDVCCGPEDLRHGELGTVPGVFAFIPYAQRAAAESRTCGGPIPSAFCIYPLRAAGSNRKRGHKTDLFPAFLHLPPMQAISRLECGTHCVFMLPDVGTIRPPFAFVPYAQRAATGSGGIRRAYSRLFCICPLSLKNCQPGRPTGKNQPAVLHRQADLICLYAAGKCPTCSGTGIIFCCITDAPGAAFLQHC